MYLCLHDRVCVLCVRVCVCLYSRHSRNSTSSSNYMSERTTSSIGALKTSKTSRFAATPPPSPHHVVCSTGNFDSVADSACLCGIGFTGPGDGVCTKCAKGSYKGTNGSDACTSCLHGKYSTANAATGAETCQNCAVGTYLTTMGNYAATDCVPCAEGTYSSLEGATDASTCLECIKGTFSNLARSACTICPAGYSSRDRSSKVTDCTAVEDSNDTKDYTVIVGMVLSMPISKADFKIDKQTSFRKGISLAAGVIMSKVKITNIETIFRRHSRHVLAERIKIHVQVAAEDSSNAASLTNKLTVENIKSFIPEAEIISSPEVVFVSNGNSSVQKEDAKEKTNTNT